MASASQKFSAVLCGCRGVGSTAAAGERKQNIQVKHRLFQQGPRQDFCGLPNSNMQIIATGTRDARSGKTASCGSDNVLQAARGTEPVARDNSLSSTARSMTPSLQHINIQQ
ncbi:unnamed protein product [Prorocentrum cordatum]|uniref:Uncharacterized protein n=1 Tax=Prorocentrum cordatum TaxID=2364126 RepID=A0ABN9W1R2_9DINO|nr:unnamed protein product [Polarella glacialis]